ncbi:hypothetical protein HF888_09580 [Bermanella marisrubri]|uniref:Uncharacterized protein n=1 Tax=Bermanella marisrubri TaxID=207949 RepID=Q1N6B4_9GAMM|nr:hypothetical protein [Bermanella marisrubri]EAT13678.1 hypothetical protein RED65_09809 [Oceanobacter sp. RED65] [Bermanella marisrubri]QIZ84458.1 hypothetical protein HF888_09580 [Bermanella marisrubri]
MKIAVSILSGEDHGATRRGLTPALCKRAIMIHKIKIFICIMFLIFISNTSMAEESDEFEEYASKNLQESWWSKQVGVVMSSLVASQYPEAFGIGITLLSPVTLATEDHDYVRYTGFGGLASVGLYNSLEMKKDKYSKSAIFKRNLVAFQILFGTLHILKKEFQYTSNTLSVVPISNGIAVGYNYEF